MLTASAATKAILASGQYLRADLYEFTMVGGTVHRFTSADVPLTVGGQQYLTGLTIKRSGITRKVGLETTSLTLQVFPQDDHPGGQPLFGGVSLARAVAAGLFYGAKLRFYKIFLSSWTDTSPGAVLFFHGRFNSTTRAGRFGVVMQFNSMLDLLNVAMPRNILQTGCIHTLFGTGCGLNKATYTTAGAVTSGGPNSVLAFSTNLTQADGYFDLGVLTFTSGSMSGVTRTVRAYINGAGYVRVIEALPAVPSTGDTFTVVPGCDKRQATCSAKFDNLLRFRGYPYVPQPETLYAGGTGGADPGVVDDPIVGSDYGGGQFPGTYQP